MTITLPRLPRTADYEMRFVDETRVQRAGTGGSLLPLSRLGDHWAIEIEVGSLSPLCARELTADILRARGQPVRVMIPQHGIDTGAPGAPRVAGAGQAGSFIAIDSITPNFAVRKGWFLTIVTGGVGRAYMVAAEVIANASGEVTVEILPMLREPPADNDVVDIAQPWLEGLATEGGGMEGGLMRAIRPGSFVIEEAQ